MYRDVTLAPDDIEWVAPVDRERLKDAAFDQAVFDQILNDLGPKETLTQFTRIHRTVANQLIRKATFDPLSSAWARRAIGLCGRLKRRRNQARGVLRATVGVVEAERFIAALDYQFPRAVWGEETDES